MSELLSDAERTFPYPVSAPLRRLRLIDVDDPPDRHNAYSDIFESLTKFLAVLCLEDHRSGNHLQPHIRAHLRGLLHPSMGHWVRLTSMICSENQKWSRIAHHVRALYQSKLPDDVKLVAERLRQTLRRSEQRIQSCGEVFELLVNYRNKGWKGHGARISPPEYAEREAILRVLLEHLIARSSFLRDTELVYVEEVTLLPTTEFRHRLKACTGSRIEPASHVARTGLAPQRLYLRNLAREQTDQAGKGDEGYIVSLHPLLTLYPCTDCRTDQVFVFNDYKEGRPSFLSYGCGHHLEPDMLGEDFEALFDLDLPKPRNDPTANGRPDEAEAVERSEELLAIALGRLSTEQYFDALDYLRQSIALAPTSESNYYAALSCMLTKSSPIEVLYYLDAALQMDPTNSPASAVRARVQSVIPDADAAKAATEKDRQALQTYAVQMTESSVSAPVVRPIYHYLTPSRYQEAPLQFWILVTCSVFGLREVVAALASVPSDLTTQVLKLCLAVSLLAFYEIFAKSMQSIYFALLQQVSGRMREHFYNWFTDQIAQTFGRFRDGAPFIRRMNLDDGHNRRYFCLALILFVIATAGSIWLTCYDLTDVRQIAAIAFDYTALWLFTSLGAPAVLRSFKILRDYSKLPLRPPVSSINRYGLNKIGRTIFLVSLPWTACFSLLTLIGYNSFSNNLIVSQLALFYFMMSVGLVWTLVTPAYLGFAISSSKEKLLSMYGEHLDTAFREFLVAPSKENAERYAWLKDKQGEVLGIGGGAMSRLTLAGVVAVNVYIIAVAALYPFFKFDWSLRGLRDQLGSVFLG